MRKSGIRRVFLFCCVALLAGESKCFVWSASCLLYSSLPVGGEVFEFGRDNPTDYKCEQTPCRLCAAKTVLGCVRLLSLKERNHFEWMT